MFRRMTRALKRTVCAVVLFVLRRALDVLGRRDSRVQRELSSLGEGFVLRLSTGEGGPQLCVRLTGGRVRRAGAEESADVTIGLRAAPIHTAGRHHPDHAGGALRGHRGELSLPLGLGRAHPAPPSRQGVDQRGAVPAGILPVCLMAHLRQEDEG